MHSLNEFFSPKAALAMRRLLPSIERSVDHKPLFTYQDWLYVRDEIGTPQVLDDELQGLGLSTDGMLPPASADLLLNAVNAYALAFDFFDTEEQALRWWRKPIHLSSTLPARAPKDWVGVPGYQEELVSRIRRTRHGIF